MKIKGESRKVRRLSGLVWAAASEVKIVMSFLGLGLLCLLLFIY